MVCHTGGRCGARAGGQDAGGNGFVGGLTGANKLIISAPFVRFQQHNVGSRVKQQQCSVEANSTTVSTITLTVIVFSCGV